MKNILLVEDNPELQRLIKGTLESQYHCVAVPTVAKAVELIQKTKIDLAVIDIGLPDGDGFQLCSFLKNSDATANIPVIFLTSKTDIQDKLMAFSVGAEDYVVKPFEPLELRARISAKFRSKRSEEVKNDTLRKGPLTLHLPYMKCFVSEQNQDHEIELTPTEFKLLFHFMSHEDHVLTRQQLLDAVWGIDANVNDRTVDVTIYTLRRKLKALAPLIESVFGAGYRFTLKANPTDQSPSNNPLL